MNVIIKKDQSKSDLASYLYACCGSPPVSAFLRTARNGNLITWPGINDVASKKYLSPSIASAKGHLNQEPTNLQTTKANLPQDDRDSFPPLNNPDVRTYESAAVIIPFTTTGKTYQDLTGRFPHKSSRGNEYLMVAYDFDSNAILAEPLKSRRGKEIKMHG